MLSEKGWTILYEFLNTKQRAMQSSKIFLCVDICN
jgi:hypothetical protein